MEEYRISPQMSWEILEVELVDGYSSDLKSVGNRGRLEQARVRSPMLESHDETGSPNFQ